MASDITARRHAQQKTVQSRKFSEMVMYFLFYLNVVKVSFCVFTSDNSDWYPGVSPISTGLEVLTNL